MTADDPIAAAIADEMHRLAHEGLRPQPRHAERIADAVRALLSQPTPSAEPDAEEGYLWRVALQRERDVSVAQIDGDSFRLGYEAAHRTSDAPSALDHDAEYALDDDDVAECGVCHLPVTIDPRGYAVHAVTPSAEPVREAAIREVLEWLDAKISAEELDMAAENFGVEVMWRDAAEPPRVEDMALGTIFWGNHLDTEEPAQWWIVGDGFVAGTHCGRSHPGDIDPSTIRNVTPPPALPEDGQ